MIDSLRESGPSVGFDPVCDARTDTLVLGSLPSRRSIASGEYYGNPRNAFWPLMTSLLGLKPEMSYDERLNALLDAGIGLWDVLQSSHRPGSLDANIDLTSARPNDFRRILLTHPRLTRIFFNGGKAAQLFRRFSCLPDAVDGRKIAQLQLPSTSPAHAAMTFSEKRDRWAVVTEARKSVR